MDKCSCAVGNEALRILFFHSLPLSASLLTLLFLFHFFLLWFSFLSRRLLLFFLLLIVTFIVFNFPLPISLHLPCFLPCALAWKGRWWMHAQQKFVFILYLVVDIYMYMCIYIYRMYACIPCGRFISLVFSRN